MKERRVEEEERPEIPAIFFLRCGRHYYAFAVGLTYDSMVSCGIRD